MIDKLYTIFASTRLAILLLGLLIAGGVLATIGPLFFGEFNYDVYGSWWFIFLLGLLCTNLLICTYERFPQAWKQIHSPPATKEQITKWPLSHSWHSQASSDTLLTTLERQLQRDGWKRLKTDTQAPFRIFEKGKYSHLGTHLVHLSVLLILLGGATGKLLGFKGYILLPEFSTLSVITSEDGSRQFPLGFTVRNDGFSIEQYPSGEVKNYRTRLSILEEGAPPIATQVEINTPYTHKGITFYQSDFERYNTFAFTIENKKTKEVASHIAPFQQQAVWKKEDLQIGVINAQLQGESVTRVKLWIKLGAGKAIRQWVHNDSTFSLPAPHDQYTIHVKQLTGSGLQVAKDPGVALVYCGFGIFIVGLLLSFFSSHRRIALLVEGDITERSVQLVGTSNKHRIGFSASLTKLAETLKKY